MGTFPGQPDRRLVRVTQGLPGTIRHVPTAIARSTRTGRGHARRAQQQDASGVMSRAVVVRYRVRPDAVDENVRLIQAVYAELAEKQPAGFRYRTVRVDDTTF